MNGRWGGGGGAAGGLESERITITKIPAKIEEDVTNHPNDQGTVNILKAVDKVLNTELFLNPAYIVSERLYAGVQTAYRYGCQTCHQLGQFGSKLGICNDCIAMMDDHPMREKWEDFLQTIPPPTPPGEVGAPSEHPPPPPPPGEVEAPSEEMEEIEEIVISDVSRGNTPKRIYESENSGSETKTLVPKKKAYALATTSPSYGNDDPQE